MDKNSEKASRREKQSIELWSNLTGEFYFIFSLVMLPIWWNKDEYIIMYNREMAPLSLTHEFISLKKQRPYQKRSKQLET